MSQNNAAITVQHVPERKLYSIFTLHKKKEKKVFHIILFGMELGDKGCGIYLFSFIY